MLTESDMDYWKLSMPSQAGRLFFPGPPDFKDKTVDIHLHDERGVIWEAATNIPPSPHCALGANLTAARFCAQVVVHQRMHQTRNLHMYECTTGWAQVRTAKGLKKGDTLLVLKDATGGLHIRVIHSAGVTTTSKAVSRPRPLPVARPAPRPVGRPVGRPPASAPPRPAAAAARGPAPKHVKKRPKPMLPPMRPKVREVDLHKRNREIEERKAAAEAAAGIVSGDGKKKAEIEVRTPQQMLEPIQLSTKAAMSIDNKANREKATVVFLGDSIIMGIPSHLYKGRTPRSWPRTLNPELVTQGRCIQNFGKNGACAEDLQVLSRSAKFNAECSAVKKAIVMAVGTNNLWKANPNPNPNLHPFANLYCWKDPVDIVVNQIMEVIEVLCHNYQGIHIVVLGVLPRGDTGYNDIDSLNRKIATFNRQLRHKVRHVEEHIATRITFMDLSSKFMADGKIVASMYIADGLHLSLAGYEFFMGEVNTELDRILTPAPQQAAQEELGQPGEAADGPSSAAAPSDSQEQAGEQDTANEVT